MGGDGEGGEDRGERGGVSTDRGEGWVGGKDEGGVEGRRRTGGSGNGRVRTWV